MQVNYIFLVLICLFYFSCSEKDHKTSNIGQVSLKYNDSKRSRPLDVEIWFPTHYSISTKRIEELKVREEKSLFKILPTIPNAKIIDDKLPLLIVSHGTGGNRFSLTWFIEKMVHKGYIVVSLGHYGNTTFNKLPREFVKWWERAIDVQFVLDRILENPKFKNHIDHEKIGGAGFSLGGYTNIALAGGLVDRTYHPGDDINKKRELPPEFPKTDEVIDFQNDSLIVHSYETYKNKVKDHRMKAFFVMAPAIGFGFHSKEQMRAIDKPVFIVAGKGDTNTPIQHNALNYHELIISSELHLFNEHVNHYVFLNESTEFGKKVAPKITIDHEKIDRKEIHDKVVEMALDFFDKHLKHQK